MDKFVRIVVSAQSDEIIHIDPSELIGNLNVCMTIQQVQLVFSKNNLLDVWKQI